MTKYKDNTAYSQNNTNSALERYTVDGYTPPAGVVGKAAVREMQRWLGGLTPDGLWGPKTQKQFDKAMAAVLKTAEVPPAPANAERLGYAEDLYKLSIGIGKSGRGNYMVRGYDPPANIKSAEDVRAFQEIHGLDVDGVWGERTKQRFDQLQQKWASQYDVDEIARLVADGIRQMAGAEKSVPQAEAIPLAGGGGKPGQAGAAQINIKPAVLSTSAMPNRAAKGYTIPQGVSDVAATQRMLGVTADGLWGEKTDSAYKELVSGGNVLGSAQAAAAQLKQLYQDVAASNLSAAQKENARALLLALEQYGDPEYQRKTLLGIQMKGGAAAFFKQPGGPAWNAMIDTQKELYYSLQDRLEQNSEETAKIPLWERVFRNEGYQELQSQRIALEQEIGAVEKRLDQLAPRWNEIMDVWNWREVEDWERTQLIRDDAKNASAEKQARDEAAAEVKAKAEKYGLPHADERFSHITRETLQARLNRFTTNPQDIIGDDWKANLQKMWNLPLEEIIARMIVGEAGDRRVSDQDRVDICYSVIVRMLDDQKFRGGTVSNGKISSTYLKQGNKSLKELLFGDNEYHGANPYYEFDPQTQRRKNGDEVNILDYHAYDINGYLKGTGAPQIWEQAMWMGIILAELFEDEISGDLYGRYDRNEWRSLADMYFDEFDAMLAVVYPQINSDAKESKVRSGYENSFVGHGTYVTFERSVY